MQDASFCEACVGGPALDLSPCFLLSLSVYFIHAALALCACTYANIYLNPRAHDSKPSPPFSFTQKCICAAWRALAPSSLLVLIPWICSRSHIFVCVQGDTTTAMVAALAAFYQKVAVAHIEAGLRTYNLYNPFPEEANRQMVGRLATFHFASTATAQQALLLVRMHVVYLFSSLLRAFCPLGPFLLSPLILLA